MRPLALACMLALLVGIGSAQSEPPEKKPPLPPPFAEPVDFVRDIQPILAARCVSCHGVQKQRAGLRLDSAAEALKGGNSGASLIAGKSAESLLIHLVAGWEPERRMPPKGAALTEQEIAKLRGWIDQGAKPPAEAATERAPLRLKSDHWAFQPITSTALPAVKNASWLKNPIDRFVLARLEKEGLAPSPEADRRTLIRRLHLDLLGLPPRPDEVDEFLLDQGTDAYERLVDRVLASPHYGERWGRHWLDAARYADSDGYEKDTGRPWAWRYRQWVIDALNSDLPYDRFVVEQLAGDLLPNATPEQRAATGFHRNTLKNLEGGVDQEEYRVAAVVDRVNTTATVFLGLTMGCCQCHDHKYDPLTQREYYQLFAFFNSDEEALTDAPLPGETAKVAVLKSLHDQHRAWLQARADAYRRDFLPKAQAGWEAGLKLTDLRKQPERIRALLLLEPEKRTKEQQDELLQHHGRQDQKLQALETALRQHDAKTPRVAQAQALKLGQPRPTHVHVRGDFLRKGAAVGAGVPAVLPPLPARAVVASTAPTANSAEGGLPNRLDLARWIVADDNPLAARVMVNWVWLHRFGRGLVATPEDFGTRGERPSHPELLDWLAAEFRKQGWSLKRLHRLMVTSAAYRQSSAVRPELTEKDPQNVLLARMPRLRLEGEIVRDASLSVSGFLVRTIGGPSVRPPQPAGIADLSYAGSVKWAESQGPDRYRRGLYTWFQRTSPYPMLMTFDSPDSNVCVVRRERSNTPLQALTLLNDIVFVEAAQGLAGRLLKERSGDDARLTHAFVLCLAREPAQRELAALKKLLASLRLQTAQDPEGAATLAGAVEFPGGSRAEAAAWVGMARTILNLDEFLTRE